MYDSLSWGLLSIPPNSRALFDWPHQAGEQQCTVQGVLVIGLGHLGDSSASGSKLEEWKKNLCWDSCDLELWTHSGAEWDSSAVLCRGHMVGFSL